MFLRKKKSQPKQSVWARTGMQVCFRAELMPGLDAEQRTFLVKRVLENQRVLLHNFEGEHSENEFEPQRFTKKKSAG